AAALSQVWSVQGGDVNFLQYCIDVCTALEITAQVIQKNQKDTVARLYNCFARAHQILGNHKKAFEYFNKSISINPYSSTAYLGRGIAEIKLNNYKDALSDLYKCIEIQPTQAEPYYWIGVIRNDYLNDHKEAITAFEKCLTFLGENNIELKAFANYGIASAYYHQKQYENTISWSKEAIRCFSGFSSSFYLIGLAELQLQNITNACEAFNTADKLGVNCKKLIKEYCSEETH
ncbi:MAG: hypothetical protein HY738_21305, partial [Bacteroidia bacterium]|nr:hypothetical protein [Bacteroidia bacterium]